MKSPMKIAIIGTHSTGKTTIIETLSSALQEKNQLIHILPEYARLCPFPINENTTIEAQKWILLQQITEETKIDHSKQVLITDRATLDNFAYMWRIGEKLNISHFEKAAAEHMATYDFIFKTRKLNVNAKEDGVRTTDGEFRDMIDRLISLLLKKHNIPFTLLPDTLDYNTHVDVINKKIEPYLVQPAIRTSLQTFQLASV